jgi:ABC-2 type transport system ATP-binding protein
MIRTKGLTRYFGDKLAVSMLDLDVKDGEIFGFIGPNGAGKTTTVRMLCCLIAPSQGMAEIDGIPVGKEEHNERIRSMIGLLPEVPGLSDSLTPYQTLDFYGKLYRVGRFMREKNITVLLKMLGMWDKKDELLGTFSKGMKQKVAIARALVHEPRLLFLDEPTAALDPLAAKTVRDFILELKKTGKTIFITTHNLAEAEKMCDRVAIFSQNLIDLGSPTELARKHFTRMTMIELGGRPADAWKTYPAAVEGLEGVVSASLDGSTLMVDVDDPEKRNPALVSMLVSLGARINFVRERPYSLEDVYVKLMGGTIEEHDEVVMPAPPPRPKGLLGALSGRGR